MSCGPSATYMVKKWRPQRRTGKLTVHQGGRRGGQVTRQVENDVVADDAGAEVDDDGPEAVVDCSGVLEPEDEDVPGDDDRVQEEQALPPQRVLEYGLEETKVDRHGAEEVPRDLGYLDDGHGDEGCPEYGHHQFVHQGSSVVLPEPLVPMAK